MAPSVGKSEAVVLRTYDLRERDLIVVLFTRSAGKLRAVARGARGGRLRRFGGVFLPGTVVDLDWFDNKRGELVRIDECTIVRSYFDDVSGDLDLSLTQAFLLELADGFTEAQDPNDDLYRLLRLCLERSCTAGKGLPAVRSYFAFWLLRLSGLFPDDDGCENCGTGLGGRGDIWLEPDHGFRCAGCRESAPGGYRMDRAMMDRLRDFAGTGLDAVLDRSDQDTPPLDARLEKPLLGCLRHHLGRDIRSLQALSAINTIEKQ